MVSGGHAENHFTTEAHRHGESTRGKRGVGSVVPPSDREGWSVPVVVIAGWNLSWASPRVEYS